MGKERGFTFEIWSDWDGPYRRNIPPLDEEISNIFLTSLTLSGATAKKIISNDRVSAVLNSDFDSNKTRLINGVYMFALQTNGSREH